MIFSQTKENKHSAFFLIVGGLLILSLSFSLATRVFHLTDFTTASVHSGASQGMRQHMDSDAAHWAPPVPQHWIYEAVSFYPRVAPAGPPLPSLLFDKSLYNRPPPSC